MKKLVLGLMVTAGFLGAKTIAANADTSTGNVSFTPGTLSMTTDATALTFAEQAITNTDAIVKTPTTPTVTVSDMRGSSAGWNLTVDQMDQFKTADAANRLTSAALTVTGVADSNNVTSESATLTPGDGTTTGATGVVANAANGTGNGTTKVTFTGSELAIPGATKKVAQNYTTTLTWNLNDSPTNS